MKHLPSILALSLLIFCASPSLACDSGEARWEREILVQGLGSSPEEAERDARLGGEYREKTRLSKEDRYIGCAAYCRSQGIGCVNTDIASGYGWQPTKTYDDHGQITLIPFTDMYLMTLHFVQYVQVGCECKQLGSGNNGIRDK